MGKQHYHRRATECLKFAKATRSEEERERMLMMASLLQSLAGAREMKAGETRKEE